jgi:hypothetical protein
MFRIRHGRVTSLASAMLSMLRMMSEGHTLPAPPRPVNARIRLLTAQFEPYQATAARKICYEAQNPDM